MKLNLYRQKRFDLAACDSPYGTRYTVNCFAYLRSQRHVLYVSVEMVDKGQGAESRALFVEVNLYHLNLSMQFLWEIESKVANIYVVDQSLNS